MSDWPNALPIAPLLDGFVETVPDVVIRTEMETGPDKVRRRTSAGVREFTMDFILSKVQTAIFDDFYLQDLNAGAGTFGFTHPRTGEDLSLRLTRPPQYTPQSSSHFRVRLEAEALPS